MMVAVLFIVQRKCFYLVVDKEGHLYYYKNRKQTNVRERMFVFEKEDS